MLIVQTTDMAQGWEIMMKNKRDQRSIIAYFFFRCHDEQNYDEDVPPFVLGDSTQ